MASRVVRRNDHRDQFRFRTRSRHLVDESNTWYPRLAAAMMRLGSAVQTKGFGLRLCSARNRLIAVWRSTSERKTPRLRRRRGSLANKPSAALSQEAEVGMK